MNNVAEAARQLSKGGIVIVYDGDEREGEADMVFCAKFADAQKVRRLRKDGGGLICAAISGESASRLNLPFLTDLLEANPSLKGLSCRKTAYGDKPAFSLQVNHRNVFTGITDNDRALTLSRLDEVVQDGALSFEREFYSPGHVFLLIGSGLENRRGHTELALELGRLARHKGAMVLCEMLGEGKALPKEEARKYAEENGFAFLEGEDMLKREGEGIMAQKDENGIPEDD
ncbi:3,4-dihydroxy-2-butanone-4-phosphate synthase [Candidatus Micrarchaeota archaeon]|nr:3,4-dihydroxy-2-butanone-4-phosphate synthase [Candidatus Micrarchaeota archaeon]